MTIKEACIATGLTRKAIRYYEAVGLISPDIDSNGYRNYSDEVVRQLAVIAILRGFRFSIEEIRESLKGDDTLSVRVEKKIAEFEEEQERLSAQLILLREFAARGRSLQEINGLRQRVKDSLISGGQTFILRVFRTCVRVLALAQDSCTWGFPYLPIL